MLVFHGPGFEVSGSTAAIHMLRSGEYSLRAFCGGSSVSVTDLKIILLEYVLSKGVYTTLASSHFRRRWVEDDDISSCLSFWELTRGCRIKRITKPALRGLYTYCSI